MGKAAQIISSATGMPRRKAEKIENSLQAAGLLVVEEQVEEEKIVVKEKKEVSKQ